jgi:lysozyme
MQRNRIKGALLALSATGLIGIAINEGYQETAAPPIKGDVPTQGFGHTGPDVKPGTKTTPVRALVTLHGDVSATEQTLRGCIGDVPLSQGEWDAYVSLAFNVGASRVCQSTLVRLLHQTPPDYDGACKQILRWTYFQGKNCADPAHARLCGGLVARRQAEYRLCMTP